MSRAFRAIMATVALLAAFAMAQAGWAQKRGGILRMYTPDSPASMSIHEEATVFSQGPMMGVFNNLLVFDQHQKQSRLETIVSGLATGWAGNEDGTTLSPRV